MVGLTFESSLKIEQIDRDTYQSVHCPLWTWPGSRVVPGGTLMALAAAAAYETVTTDFSIDTLQAHFLSGPNCDGHLQMTVQRLSDGGRFATRVISVRQNSNRLVHVTCSFVRTAAMKGPSMTHSSQRKSSQTVGAITLDDLEPGRNQQGPVFQYERLPLLYTGPDPRPLKPAPMHMIYTCAATVSPHIESANPRYQALGIIALSDYHVLDAPPTLHGLSFGTAAIGDATQTPTPVDFDRFTSINHAIYFHVHEHFRADELCYIEVQNPWTNRRRAEIQSRIFNRAGGLIATTVQEAYYVLKPEKGDSKL